MGDMAKTVVPKSDQMNAEDLLTGPRTFTITRVVVGDGDEQPVSVWFAEFSPRRPFKPSKTVRRLMIRGWGDESKEYVGRRMTLWTDPDVMWAGQAIGGIRVSHMSGLKKQMRLSLAAAKSKRATYIVDPIPDAPPPSPLAALVAALEASGVRGKMDMLTYCRDVVGRPIAKSSDLTPAEIDAVHEALVASTSAAPVAPAPEVQDPPPGFEPDLEPSDAERAQYGGDRG